MASRSLAFSPKYVVCDVGFYLKVLIMALLEEFDYQHVMQHAHGDVMLAKARMEKSFRAYWAHRANHIARKRCKSAMLILKRLKVRITETQQAKKMW